MNTKPYSNPTANLTPNPTAFPTPQPTNNPTSLNPTIKPSPDPTRYDPSQCLTISQTVDLPTTEALHLNTVILMKLQVLHF